MKMLSLLMSLAVPCGVLAQEARTLKNLRYGPHEERNALDLYLPAKPSEKRPLIIWVHGGGWQNGSKDRTPLARMVENGFAVASINYRLSRHATYPAQIHDCKAAVRFLRANAQKYGLDPDRFGVAGASAGGHLVALMGTTGDVKELEGKVGDHTDVSSRVQAVCDFFGPTDLSKMNAMAGDKGTLDHDSPNSPEAKLLGGPIQKTLDKVKLANPITYVSKDDPPFLILHGDQDFLVALGQSEILHKALNEAGVKSELLVIKGAGHGRGVMTPATLTKVEQFFQQTLQNQQ